MNLPAIVSFRKAWFSAFAAALFVTLSATAQEPPAEGGESYRIQDNDNVDVQPGNNAAIVQLTLARAPASAEGATLEAVSGEYVYWSVPLQKQGNQWRAQVPKEDVEELLISEQLVARFPTGNDASIRVTVPRDRYLSTMEDIAALLRGEPLFFEAPPAPELPEVPAPSVSRAEAAAFAVGALRWDFELAKYLHEFSAASSRAHALYMDLSTAGRLPWQPEAINQLAQGYQPLEQREQEIARMREQWRSNARQFVQQWNSANASEDPLTLNFAEAS